MDLSTSRVTQVAVHRIGNKLRDEPLKLSEKESEIDEPLANMLLRGYLRGIAVDANKHAFHHDTNIELNVVRFHVADYFASNCDFLSFSKALARHLYEQSIHPNIRQGELFVIRFDSVPHDGTLQPAIGIFKSEIAEEYITVREGDSGLVIHRVNGVNPQAIDKGALMFPGSEIVYAVDRIGKSRFWHDGFLAAKKYADPTTSAKFVAFVAEALTASIQDAIARSEFSTAIKNAIEENGVIESSFLENEATKRLDQQTIMATRNQAERKFRVQSGTMVANADSRAGRALVRALSRLTLAPGVDLFLAENLSLVDLATSNDGDLVLTIRLRRAV